MPSPQAVTPATGRPAVTPAAAAVPGPARGTQAAAAILQGLRPLRERIEAHDVILLVFTAGLSSRADTATPARAAAVRSFALPIADAAEALAVAASVDVSAVDGDLRQLDELAGIARAAAALRVRSARARARLLEYEAAARRRPARRCD